MRPLRGHTILLIGVGGILVGAAVTFVLLAVGRTPMLITPWLAPVFLVIGIGLIVGGREVRRLKAREDTRITPLQAARVAFFARSAALNGAGFTGFLLGIVFVSLSRWWAPATSAAAVGAGIAAGGAMAMTIMAFIVERWCVDDSGGSWDATSSRNQKAGRNRDAGAAGAARVSDEMVLQ